MELEDVYDAITKKKQYVIWRLEGITPEGELALKERALQDLGEKYDVLLILGKTLTWLTGIPYFARYVEADQKEFCVTRVALWYKDILKERFGKATHHEVTTDIIDDWCKANPERWTKVDEKLA